LAYSAAASRPPFCGIIETTTGLQACAFGVDAKHIGTAMNEYEQERVRELLVAGTRLMQRGDTAEAQALLEEAYALDDSDFDIALNLSAAYILRSQFSRATPLLEALAEREPTNAMIWTNLGAAYLGNPVLAGDERQLKAIGAFEKALVANPEAPNVAYNIGLIHKDRRERDSAISWFEQALRTNPKDKDARYWLKTLREQ
jgi:tetratricopeptide (TPR) repeat protein